MATTATSDQRERWYLDYLAALGRSELLPATRWLMATLALDADPATGDVPAGADKSVPALAEQTNMSERALRQNLQRAVRAGWLVSIRPTTYKDRRYNAYRVVMPGGTA